MMNCFEARQDFAALWRRTLANSRRTELLTHLSECHKCDRAFRVFALSAPVLHSGTEPSSRRTAAPRRSAAASGSAGVLRNSLQPRRWMAMCAVLTIFVASGFAAWLSVAAPMDSLSDAISNDNEEPAVELFSTAVAPTTNDFAG